jgi:hypothetical protein
MRYWGWLAIKLALALAIVWGLWEVASIMAGPGPTGLLSDWPRFGSDLAYTFAIGFVVIAGCGLLWLCAADQVYRCHTCARRLKMPETEGGNYSHTMLGGSPFTTFICTYGHGKLYVPDVHLSSSRAMRWIGYGSLWEDLMQAERTAARK